MREIPEKIPRSAQQCAVAVGQPRPPEESVSRRRSVLGCRPTRSPGSSRPWSDHSRFRQSRRRQFNEVSGPDFPPRNLRGRESRMSLTRKGRPVTGAARLARWAEAQPVGLATSRFRWISRWVPHALTVNLVGRGETQSLRKSGAEISPEFHWDCAGRSPIFEILLTVVLPAASPLKGRQSTRVFQPLGYILKPGVGLGDLGRFGRRSYGALMQPSINLLGRESHTPKATAPFRRWPNEPNSDFRLPVRWRRSFGAVPIGNSIFSFTLGDENRS